VNGAAAADVSFTTPVWANGAAASTLSWDLVDDDGTAAITSYSAESTTSSKSQNGTAAGSITDIAIATDGTITATLSTGETVDVAKLALASFNNAEGLQKLGSSRYGATQAAGLPSIGGAGEGVRGTLTGSALEGSNVDMATEFTKMILAQRGYQASSKTITVADELLQDTLNLKR
jgi:flagellar hook protein FlgE